MSRDELATGAVLFGIAGAHGVAIGPAVVVEREDSVVPRRHIRGQDCDGEWQRFLAAVTDVKASWRAMLAQIPEGRPEGAILEAYVLMVGDELLARAVHQQIHELGRCAEWAVSVAVRGLARQLVSVEDAYMRERSRDVEFVGKELLRGMLTASELSGETGKWQPVRVERQAILVAHDLSPADTAQLNNTPVCAIVTEMGSRTSHTSIMARALRIPAVVGLGEASSRITSGDILIVDGLRGTVTVKPSDEQLEDAHRRMARHRAMAEMLDELRDVPATTLDGIPVTLHANIELPDEAAVALEHGALGVGLYRTEFLYVGRREAPSEEMQLAMFRKVVTAMGNRPVTLRTFDVGGDKFVSSFKLPHELNPMLGLRAVRLQLTEPALLLEHLRAMVRASAFGDVRVMVPLVSTLDELTLVRELFGRAREQVRASGHPQAERIPLGVMIEVPAAAVTADLFAREADFMSIGTNDLVQYTLGVDRANRALAHVATPFHPAVLRLIDGVLRAGREHGCPVSVCGEMASEPYGALLLMGLGLRELSMESVAVPEIKAAIRRVEQSELDRLAEQALLAPSAQAVAQLLVDALEPLVGDLPSGQASLESVRAPSLSSRRAR